VQKIFKPLFLLLFVVIPQLASLGYLSWAMSISNMKPMLPEVITALIFSLAFGLYAYIHHQEKVLDTKIHIAISVIYSLFAAYAVLFNSESLFAESFVSPRLIFIEACIISVLYSILGIACHTTPPDKTYPTAKYVTGIISVPLIWYLGINLLNGINSETFALILIIASAYAIIFLIAKILFVWKLNKVTFSFETLPDKKYYIAVFIIAFFMPLGGLALNQSFADLDGSSVSAGLFGDFSHPMFYIIAALNGMMLLIPPMDNKGLRLALFYLKSAGYAYILYFFIVFLPSLPMGIVGLVFYGLGIFVFTPVMVLVIQSYHLVKEWVVLTKSFDKWRLTAVFCLGIVTLPLCLTAAFWGDKGNFTVAARYLEQKDFNYSEPVSMTRLERTLKNIRSGLRFTRGRFGFSEGNIPIISEYYTEFVLGGKVISEENILTLENLFLDAGHNLGEANLSGTDVNDNRVRLLAADSDTRFDEKSGVYKSWINLKLENTSLDGNGEYITNFEIPEGVYISDYYLDVGGIRKEGILADRRAALFIYRKIVNTRRDPGLLRYIGRNNLELRVFPFAPNEVRETGFEIMHSQKFDLTLDKKTVSLEGDNEQKEVAVEGGVLLPAAQKEKLESVVRTPKYYFVIDSSENSNVSWHIRQVEEYAKANHIRDAEVIFASYKLEKFALSQLNQAEYRSECGYNLDMAVNMILKSCGSTKGTNTFPIIIAVSDNMPGAVFPKNVRPLSKKFPESQYYYALNHNLTLIPYSYDDNTAGSTVDNPIVAPILEYYGVYVLDNNENELVLTDPLTDPLTDKLTFTGNQYQNAILLDVMGQKTLLSGNSPDSVELVRASFRSRILTPQTSFIVVETQEQEKELLDLQERILNSNGQTPTVTLDEPSLISIMLILLVVFILNKKLRRFSPNC